MRMPRECSTLPFNTPIWKPIWKMIIIPLITWQAPRAGSMRRILCSDWLPERARWSDAARPGLPVSFPQIKFRQSSSECTKVFSRWNYFLLRKKDFSVFMEPEKASTRMKTKKTKMLISFKNTFCSKNRQIKHKSLFWIWQFEFEIWIWNVTNQMIVISAFIQSGYRVTRYHFSI